MMFRCFSELYIHRGRLLATNIKELPKDYNHYAAERFLEKPLFPPENKSE
jgi:hypothetical protein